MAGVTMDVCLAFAAMQAVEAGYNVYGVVDASGGLDVTTRELAIARMKDYGITPINWTTVAVELQRDWRLATTSHRPSGLLVLPLLRLVTVPEVEHVEQVPDRGDVGRYVG
jgi:hypothetical protein